MAIEQMLLLNMTFHKDELDKVLCLLNETHDYDLQPSNKIVRKVKDVKELEINSCYEYLLNRLDELSVTLNLSLDDVLVHDDFIDMNKTEEFIENQIRQVNKIKKVEEELIQEKNENQMALEMLKCLSSSQIDLDRLLNCHYITARFGCINKKHITGLKYYEGKPFIFKELGKDKNYVWCLYIATNNVILEIDNIFKSLAFKEIIIPDFVHGTIEEARMELSNQTKAMDEYILRMEQKISVLKESIKIDLLKIYANLKYFQKIDLYKKNVVDYKSKYAVYGFVSKRLLRCIKEKYKHIKDIEFLELPKDVLVDQGVIAPCQVHNPWWSKPFEIISQVKQDDEIDMTNMIAIIFYVICALFIGDIGIGIIALIIGLLMKKSKQGKLLIAVSVAIMAGGLLYGSLFYRNFLYHTILDVVPVLYRVINGIVFLCTGMFSVASVKGMKNEKSLMTRLFSLKGLCGNIAIYTLLIYLIGSLEIHLYISFIPVFIVLMSCIVLIILRTILYKELE